MNNLFDICQTYARRATWGLATALTAGAIASLPATAGSFRSIDGSGNNIANPNWGEAHTELLRLTSPAYEDGLSVPRGGFSPSSMPSARAVSNAVSAQSGSVTNSVHASDWLWQWGQFLDHDLDLTEAADPAEPFNIAVPQGDPFFDPFHTGTQEIGLNRSIFLNDGNGVRQQFNEITAYIDASMVYGSDATRAAELRAGTNGLLKTSAGNLLPFNTAGLPNAGGTSSNLFLAGDVRANEQIGLASVHTLFVREHNRLATDIKASLDGGDADLVAKRDAAIAEPGNSINDEDDFIYESTRKVVGAQIQAITYNEFLPILLGEDVLAPFMSYDDTVNAGISNEFSTAAYRVGHTMLSPTLKRIDPTTGEEAAEGDIALLDAFFSPDEIVDNGIDSLLLGLASQKAQEVDTLVIDDVRNFLFGPPGSGGFDLASLNIQRGRDHGLGGINQVRDELGLGAYGSFLDLTGGDADLANAFASVYDSIDDVDLWIGGLAEQHVFGGMVGETFSWIIGDQFRRLRDGDRFFYLNDLDHLLAFDAGIKSVTLADIIRRNTDITDIQDNVFLIAKSASTPEPSMLISLIALSVGGAGMRWQKRRLTKKAESHI